MGSSPPGLTVHSYSVSCRSQLRHTLTLFFPLRHQSNKAFILDGPADMPDVDADALEEEALAEEAEEAAAAAHAEQEDEDEEEEA